MAKRQGTLIYIEQENLTEAEFMSRSFVSKEIKNRAYLNALGAELVIKYLGSEGIDVEGIHNIHSISKILEQYDIADILLPNIHIDVRVVFDENQIFIPKSHFENNIVPSVYAILKLDSEFKAAEFLGYVKPSQINKNNENENYYFVSRNRLSSTDGFVNFIKNFNSSTSVNISEEDFLLGRELSVELNDHNISDEQKQKLLELLLINDTLRESVLEFDNFETLAYSAAPDLAKTIGEIDFVKPIDTEIEQPSEEIKTIEDDNEEDSIVLSDEEFQQFTQANEENNNDEQNETTQEETLDENISEDNILIDEQDNLEVNDIQDLGEITEDINGETLLESESEDLTLPETETISQTEEPKFETFEEEFTPKDDDLSIETLDKSDISNDHQAEQDLTLPEVDTIDNGIAQTDEIIEVTKEEPKLITETETFNYNNNVLSVDSLLDQKIAQIDEQKQKPEKSLGQTIAQAVEKSMEAGTSVAESALELGISSTAAAAAASALGAAAETTAAIDAASTVSDQAIKLASVAGDTVENLLDKNMEKQPEFIDKLDTDNLDTNVIPNDLSVDDINSTSFNTENNISDSLINETMNLSDFDVVNKSFDDDLFDINTVDMSEISTISSDIIEKDAKAEEDAQLLNSLEDATDPDYEFLQENNISGSDYDIEPENNSNDLFEDVNQNIDSDLSFENIPEQNIDYAEIKEQSNEFTQDEIEDIGNTLENNTNEISDLETLTIENETKNSDFIEDENLQDEILSDTTEEETKNEKDIENGTEQDWMDDTNYDNLKDAEPTQDIDEEQEIQSSEISQEAETSDEIPDENDTNALENSNDENMIVEPEQDNTPYVFAAAENSIVISSRKFKVGEFQIDINNPTKVEYESSEPLENLYDEENSIPGKSLLRNPGTMSATRQTSSMLSKGLGIVGTLIAFVLVGVIGFSVSKMFKTPTEEAPQPITDEVIPTTDNIAAEAENTLKVDRENVMTIEHETDALASTATKQNSTTQTQQPELGTPSKKAAMATSYIDVKKLTWEVPDYVSYNPSFKQYFQSAGKSLKLSLTSDLLLATDYIYSNEVRVSVTFDKEGNFKNSQIILSSGSTQVDSIVLRTVNQVIKVLKAPHSIGNDESTTAILKIYF